MDLKKKLCGKVGCGILLGRGGMFASVFFIFYEWRGLRGFN
jgi:hypothetical protein